MRLESHTLHSVSSNGNDLANLIEAMSGFYGNIKYDELQWKAKGDRIILEADITEARSYKLPRIGTAKAILAYKLDSSGLQKLDIQSIRSTNEISLSTGFQIVVIVFAS